MKKTVKKKSSPNYTLIAIGFFILLISLGYGGYKYMNYYTSRDWYEKSLAYMEEENYRYAELCLYNALIYDREYSEAYFLRAKLEIMTGTFHWGNIAEGVKKAIAYADEPTKDMYELLGKGYFYSDESSLAKNAFNKVLTFDEAPTDSLYYFMACISYNEGAEQKGNEYLNKFVEKRGHSLKTKFTLIDYYLGNNRIDDAYQAFEESHKFGEPSDPDYYYTFGEYYHSIGDSTKACELLSTGKEKNSLKSEALYLDVCVKKEKPTLKDLFF